MNDLLAARFRDVALPLVLIGCGVLPRPVLGQEIEQSASRDSALVHGVIQDQQSGAAVPGAAVTLTRMGESGSSVIRAADDQGRFRFVAVGPGTYRLAANMLGYRVREDTLVVEGSTEVRLVLTLTASPLPLDPLLVEVVRRPWLSPDLEAFEARRARLHGTFFDRAEIEERNPRVISDLLRTVPSTQVVGGILYSLRTATINSVCPFTLYVDGVLLGTGEIDTGIPPDMVEAIEVYRSIAQVPVQYSGNPCGVVLVWLRRGSAPAPQRDPGGWWKSFAVVGGIAGLLWAISR